MRRKQKYSSERDCHAEYLARSFGTYDELLSFHRFFGGCLVSPERYRRAKLKIKKAAN